jgi:hypothetical protein
MKVLVHNIRMLVHSIYELDIDPQFWGEQAETPALPPAEGNGEGGTDR